MKVSALVAVACTLVLALAGNVAAESGSIPIPIGNDSDVLVLSLRAGDVVDASWAASGLVEFRIELLNGAELFSQTVQTGTATVTIPLDGVYVFSFRNRTLAQVTVSWTISKRLDIAAILIALVAAILILLAVIAVWRSRRRPRGWGPMPPQPPAPPGG